MQKRLRLFFFITEGFEGFIDKRVEARRLTSALLTGVEIGEGTLLSKLFIFWTEKEREKGERV